MSGLLNFYFLVWNAEKGRRNSKEASRLSAEVTVMKINGTGGSFYGYRTSGSTGKKSGVSSPLAGGANSDQVTLSKQVLAVVQMQNRLRAIEEARENAENSPEAQALDSMQKTMKIMKICNKIAARIRAGDRVPLKDLRYLMKHDIRAYQMAMASRKPKEDPKEWESAVPKGEEEDEQSVARTGEQTDGVSASFGCECSSGMSSDGGSSGGTGTETSGGEV